MLVDVVTLDQDDVGAQQQDVEDDQGGDQDDVLHLVPHLVGHHQHGGVGGKFVGWTYLTSLVDFLPLLLLLKI